MTRQVFKNKINKYADYATLEIEDTKNKVTQKVIIDLENINGALLISMFLQHIMYLVSLQQTVKEQDCFYTA